MHAASSHPESEGPNPAIYSTDNPYPAAWAELASVQRMDAYTIAFVRVFPVQYRPLRGELRFADRVEVEVLAAPAPAERASAMAMPPRGRRAARDRVAAIVDNPSRLVEYDHRQSATLQSHPSLFDYLLVTRSNLVSAFDPLLTLKREAGLRVKVETVETIGITYPGRDLPEKIRNCIQEAYSSGGVSYVLLGGDVATVPCRYAHVNMGSLVPSPPLVPTDLYFSCLDGSWDSDGDNRFGEPNDGEGGGDVDLLAEVFVGRAPVDTVSEVQVFVEKTVRYAAQSHPGVTNVVFLAERLAETPGGTAQGGAMFDPLLSLFSGYQITWLDDRFTLPAWTRSDALDVINASPHAVLLNGHGNDFTLIGLENYPWRPIEIHDLDAFTNPWPFLAYSVGCNVGQFDNDRFSPDSVGEELVKRHDRGAFAAVLNSRLGWYDPQDEAKYSGEFQRQFFDQVLVQGERRLGAANQLGKQNLLAHLEMGGIMTYRWCYYEITLFGDPDSVWQVPTPPPIDMDTDGDGLFDWQEDIAGTDPARSDSVLAVRLAPAGPAGGVRLEWPSTSHRTYAVWCCDDLTVGSFTLLTNHLAATPPANALIDSRPMASKRFYRVSAQR